MNVIKFILSFISLCLISTNLLSQNDNMVWIMSNIGVNNEIYLIETFIENNNLYGIIAFSFPTDRRKNYVPTVKEN